MAKSSRGVTVAALTILSLSAQAAVSGDEAKQLGGATLTAFGAEKAGNKEGTIPPYSGEGIKSPANFDPNSYTRPDPFAAEKPLFSITAQNATQYEDKLDGFKEMFRKYPNFRMDVYPSHRTATFPKWVLDNIAKNTTSCKGQENELILGGCYGGMAFPIPKNGIQVMWNHLTRYTAQSWKGASTTYVVTSSGNAINNGTQIGVQQSEFYDPAKKSALPPNTVYWQVRLDHTAPARKAGEKMVLVDALDNINIGRRAYQYIPGQRRVKLAPDLNYDTPSPIGGGAMTMDDATVFLGPLDRYDWKLVGKKEKFIPYNSFKLLTEHTACTAATALSKNFLNPDCVRWELHRVWVVEASLKPGYRHIYPKRYFYWDEDGFGAGMSENYDGSGKLYRLNISLPYPYYAGEDSGMMADLNAVYDLQTGSYGFNGLTADPGTGWVPQKRQNTSFFSPEALAGEGVR